jgi:hypothetical protein
VLERGEELVAERLSRPTDADRARITGVAEALVAEATARAS